MIDFDRRTITLPLDATIAVGISFFVLILIAGYAGALIQKEANDGGVTGQDLYYRTAACYTRYPPENDDEPLGFLNPTNRSNCLSDIED